MSKKALLVSDTHNGLDILSRVVEKENFDFVIHSGDFANITEEEKHSPEAQNIGVQIYKNTIEILKSKGKPVIVIPGNHDADCLFPNLNENTLEIDNVILLGKGIIKVEGINFIGLGGAPPGRLDNGIAFAGHPWRTAEECSSDVERILSPQMESDCKFVVVTHFPPYDFGFMMIKGENVAAGDVKIQELLDRNADKVILHISGHLHKQLYQQRARGLVCMNPGSILNLHYAVVNFRYTSDWEVESVELKNLYLEI